MYNVSRTGHCCKHPIAFVRGEFLGDEGLDVAANTEVTLVLSGLFRQNIPKAASIMASLKHCQSQNQEEPKKEDLVSDPFTSLV